MPDQTTFKGIFCPDISEFESYMSATIAIALFALSVAAYWSSVDH
jgi:hypothetical protein